MLPSKRDQNVAELAPSVVLSSVTGWGNGMSFLFLNPFGLNYANSSFLPMPHSSGTQRAGRWPGGDAEEKDNGQTSSSHWEPGQQADCQKEETLKTREAWAAELRQAARRQTILWFDLNHFYEDELMQLIFKFNHIHLCCLTPSGIAESWVRKLSWVGLHSLSGTSFMRDKHATVRHCANYAKDSPLYGSVRRTRVWESSWKLPQFVLFLCLHSLSNKWTCFWDSEGYKKKFNF